MAIELLTRILVLLRCGNDVINSSKLSRLEARARVNFEGDEAQEGPSRSVEAVAGVGRRDEREKRRKEEGERSGSLESLHEPGRSTEGVSRSGLGLASQLWCRVLFSWMFLCTSRRPLPSTSIRSPSSLLPNSPSLPVRRSRMYIIVTRCTAR